MNFLDDLAGDVIDGADAPDHSPEGGQLTGQPMRIAIEHAAAQNLPPNGDEFHAAWIDELWWRRTLDGHGTLCPHGFPLEEAANDLHERLRLVMVHPMSGLGKGHHLPMVKGRGAPVDFRIR